MSSTPDHGLDAIRAAARLARLDTTPAEEAELCAAVARVLAHFATLQDVPVAGVEPLCTPADHEPHAGGALRPGEVEPSLPRELLLELAPEHDGACYRVPKAVGGAE